MDNDVSLETIVSLAKRRGFVFPGSELYGGLANSWDYGPLGVLLKNNIRDAWWRHFVRARHDMVGLDAAILMNPKVWQASGHVANFTDPLVDCRHCRARHRADHLISSVAPEAPVDTMTLDEMNDFLKERSVKCSVCGESNLTEARRFNLLFETYLGTVEGDKQAVYLRGELAQSMFVDFKQIMDSMRKTIPFGIAQAGKVFRNEITPGNFTFRTLEFDLMEFEYFVREEKWSETFEYWLAEMQAWLVSLGLSAEKLRVREHSAQELSHYSKRTVDIEYETPFGWKELLGLAYRTDFDLKNHSEASGVDLRVTDPSTGDKYFPHVIEPTFGLTRLTLMVMLAAYTEEEVKRVFDNPLPAGFSPASAIRPRAHGRGAANASASGAVSADTPSATAAFSHEPGKNPLGKGYQAPSGGETRVVMKFDKQLAPYQVAVLPLSKKDELIKVAQPLADALAKQFSCDFDVTQSIGKRYRRQDEIGTPYCVTVDFDSLADKQVTVRERDSMKQVRIPIDRVLAYLVDNL